MYKVLLAGDEFCHKEALRSAAFWEACGCTVCGRADHGLIGLELARTLKPDIVLADLQMPFMDGMELVARLQVLLPDTIFVVSGHGDFEAVRRGIDLGIQHYALKPVDEWALKSLLCQMAEELDIRAEKRREYASLRFWAKRNIRENRRAFLEMLLDGEEAISPERFSLECDTLQLPIRSGGYAVCCLRITTGAPVHLSQPEWEERLRLLLRDEAEATNFVLHCSAKQTRILFFSLAAHQWDEGRMRARLQKLQIRCMQEMACTVAAGVGGYCADYSGLPRSCAEAENVMTILSATDLVTQMLQYIHDNYADPDLTLQKIAKALHSNYSYLSTQFAKALGISASRYITRFRMTKAAHALRQGKGNMIQIAGGVGYTDVKYFYRCFKKEFEMTPNQYLSLLHKHEKQRT